MNGYASPSLKLLLIRVPDKFDYSFYANRFSLLNWHKINSYLQYDDRLRAFTSELLKKYWLPSILGVSPTDLELAYTINFKPYISSPESISKRISFNISHSGDYVIIGVSFSKDISIGIDIELIKQSFPIQEAKSIVFSNSEQNLIGSSINNFFKLWTKKESLIKAIGYGFSHEYFKTTKLSLADFEIKYGYQIVSKKLGQYFLAICLLSFEN